MRYDNENGNDVDALYLYDNIIQEVMSGRTEGHKCPICGDGDLDCRYDEDMKIFIKCQKCGRFFEGMLA